MSAEHPRDLGPDSADPGRVDLDLLADYAAGALDGTPEHDRVARLVTAEPRWAEALDDLRAADAMVRADLDSLAREPEPMPADVADRLQRSFAAETPPPASEAEVIPLARRRRRYRIAAAGAAAAGVIALAGSVGHMALQGADGAGGTDQAKVSAGADTGEATSAEDAPGAEGPDSAEGLAAGPYPAAILSSGRDYRADSLASAASLAVPGRRASVAAPSALSRLADPAALRGCLTAIRQIHPGSPKLVDYARYQGSPSVVVVLQRPDARPLVVAAGPDCGADGADVKGSATA